MLNVIIYKADMMSSLLFNIFLEILKTLKLARNSLMIIDFGKEEKMLALFTFYYHIIHILCIIYILHDYVFEKSRMYRKSY